MLHLWWTRLFLGVCAHTLLSLFIHPCLLSIRVPGRWIQFGMACVQTGVCPSPLNRCFLPIRFVGDGSAGRNKPWQVASPSRRSLAVSVSTLMSLSVAADMAITCYWKDVKALGIQPGTSLSCPSCKNTNGSIWLPSCIIIETFSVQTVSLSGQRWLSWLADWFPMTKFACLLLMVSAVDMTPGEGGEGGTKKSPHGRESWQTERSLSFRLCNSWLRSDPPPACQAERISGRGRPKRKKNADGNNKAVTDVSIDGAGDKQKLRRV